MQKVYLSKTQSGKYGLFSNHILVLELSKYHYNQYRNNPVIYYNQCQAMQFNCINDIDLTKYYKIGRYLIPYCKPSKIYFTVKTDSHTYYYESNCQDLLHLDLTNICNDIGLDNKLKTQAIIYSVTFSNQLPKGILL